jgi:cytohesin
MTALVLMGLLARCGGGAEDPAAPDASQVTCPPGWGTGAFFRTATPAQVAACVEAGESLSARDSDGETPLHLAGSFSDDPAVIRVLLDAGARPDVPNNDDDTVLCVTVERNENPLVIQALLDGGSRPNEGCRWGYAPLHMAARYNASADVTDALIRAGADVNLVPPPTYDESGNWIGQHGPPLQIAAIYQENPAVVDLLVQAGADLRDSLRRAAGLNEGPGVLGIVSILLAAGADLSGCLHSSLFNAVHEVTDLLISAGADLNEGVVMELIRGQPIEGATPLHFAAASQRSANLEAVGALLEAGADPNIQDSTGRTPLDWAESSAKTQIAALLRQHGGRPGG